MKPELQHIFRGTVGFETKTKLSLGVLSLLIGLTSGGAWFFYAKTQAEITNLSFSQLTPTQLGQLQDFSSHTFSLLILSGLLSSLLLFLMAWWLVHPPAVASTSASSNPVAAEVPDTVDSDVVVTSGAIESETTYQWEPLELIETERDSVTALALQSEPETLNASAPPEPFQEPVSHILIVDDDTGSIQTLKKFLKFHNYTLASVLDGQEALALLKRGFCPDLILLDVPMSGTADYGVLQAIRLQFTADQLPVILISAHHQIEDIVQGLELGANDYLTKPIIKDELLACIHTHLQNKQLKQEALRLTEAHEKQLSQFLEALPVGVAVHNPDGSIFYCNQMAQYLLFGEKQLEITSEQISSTFQIYQSKTGAPYPTAQLPVMRALQGECVIAEDLEIRHASHTIPLEVRGTPVVDDAGQIVYALVTFQDITERKRAEQILSAYSMELEQEVTQRTTELAAANSLLQVEIQERKEIERALYLANQELQRLVNVDGLTRIANRRCFDERLQWEWQRLTREEQPLSLILFDVDYFKRFNDCYGHQAGDACLLQVAQAVVQVVNRPADLVARYGGEEFAVILPHTNPAGAIAVAQHIQSAVQALQIPHQQSSVSPYLTISLGIACIIPTLNNSVEALIASADAALYTAKQQGRNCYSVNFWAKDHDSELITTNCPAKRREPSSGDDGRSDL